MSSTRDPLGMPWPAEMVGQAQGPGGPGGEPSLAASPLPWTWERAASQSDTGTAQVRTFAKCHREADIKGTAWRECHVKQVQTARRVHSVRSACCDEAVFLQF